MYNVYWMRGNHPQNSLFPTDKMVEALHLMEMLRTNQRNSVVDRNGDMVSFIGMVSEHPDSVGNSGVDVTGPDYDWKKRRI